MADISLQAMPSQDDEDAKTPTKPKSPATPRRASAVKRTPNGTPRPEEDVACGQNTQYGACEDEDWRKEGGSYFVGRLSAGETEPE